MVVEGGKRKGGKGRATEEGWKRKGTGLSSKNRVTGEETRRKKTPLAHTGTQLTLYSDSKVN